MSDYPKEDANPIEVRIKRERDEAVELIRNGYDALYARGQFILGEQYPSENDIQNALTDPNDRDIFKLYREFLTRVQHLRRPRTHLTPSA